MFHVIFHGSSPTNWDEFVHGANLKFKNFDVQFARDPGNPRNRENHGILFKEWNIIFFRFQKCQSFWRVYLVVVVSTICVGKKVT